nr:DNA helicase [Tanacetum cinerariifolium]
MQIDEYISAKIPNLVEDPRGYKVVSDLMRHEPCGAANLGTTCMQNRPCTASATSAEIRTRFAQILVYYDVADPAKLWTKHWQTIRDDIPANVSEATEIPNYHVNTAELQWYILYKLETILNRFGESATDFGL